jgi:hypothetical protein
MMTIATTRLVLTPVLAVAIATAVPSAQAPGLPDPARLPSRPGLPGTGSGPGAPPRDTSARSTAVTGTGIVRGRVIAGDTGLPLRRARVVLRPHAGAEARMTLTDAEGVFSFAGLPAGRYDLQGGKARYVDTRLGARGPNRPGRAIEVAAGQTIDSLTLTLPAAGVITGRVLDDAGDVMTDVMVMPMRFRTMNGERQLSPMGRPAQSDDTGTFRLFGLAPGAYYLSARTDEMSRFGADQMDPDVTGFAPTYFPGTSVAEEAQPIHVVAGAEVVADLALIATRLTSVSGFVVDAAGRPATGGHVSTRGARGFLFGHAGGSIKPDGTFILSGVAPGDYTIHARPTFGEPSMFQDFNQEGARVAMARVTVAGEPVSGVRLVVREPIRVPVTTTFEDPVTRPERVIVSAGSMAGEGGMAKVGDDGRLTLEVVPGAYHVSASAAPPWYVKRMLYRGREVETMEEVELTAEPGGRLDVIFTTKAATVTGGVTDGGGKAITDYTVVILPEDAERTRRMPFGRVLTATPDAQGRFRVTRLPAGSYVAAAVEDLDPETMHEPEVLDALRRIGETFRATDGGTVTVSLTLGTIP